MRGEKCSKTESDIENTNEDFESWQKEKFELLKPAIADAMDEKIRNMDKEIEHMEISPPSKRHKIRMNRLFRERAESSRIPFPEADNLYERVRSKLVTKFKINEIFDRRKERRSKRKT